MNVATWRSAVASTSSSSVTVAEQASLGRDDIGNLDGLLRGGLPAERLDRLAGRKLWVEDSVFARHDGTAVPVG
jgi:hypothetical protein